MTKFKRHDIAIRLETPTIYNLFSHNFRITYRSLRTYILLYVTLPLLASKSQEFIPSVGRFLIKIVQLVLFKLFCCWFAFFIIPFSLQSPFSLYFFVCKFLFCCLINNNSRAFLSHTFLRRGKCSGDLQYICMKNIRTELKCSLLFCFLVWHSDNMFIGNNVSSSFCCISIDLLF